ncbi:RNA-directed DNA polymerase from mobile element jockey [Plakobranchus ocellatus]|uniref:RNA-directed DNA polymerase from mobile element jockey n=1 Tax=Plakobranchus ocellatus TaxID=259542 RepID=A0AAV3ZM34_9GAST|nr:RNA-directed DNA polymerase from mobile element jockey [Plakobranchus ocellatus]
MVGIHKTISTRTFASAVKSQLRTKPAALPKDSGRIALSAPPKGKKAQKDSPAPSPQEAQGRKDTKPLGKHSIALRLWPWMSNFKEMKLLLNRSQSAVVALQECRLGKGQSPPRGFTLLLPRVSKLSLAQLFEQLPKPFLVLGDFNTHSPAWVDSRRDGRGRMLEEFTAENDFGL